MAHKTYSFKLKDLTSDYLNGKWHGHFTMKDWDDDITITFTVDLKHQPIDSGNLSIKTFIPDEPVSV